MAHLSFRIKDECQEPYIEIFVDGENFGAKVKEALGDRGFHDLLPWGGGDYTLNETVLGSQAQTLGEHRLLLLACGCGYTGCGGDVYATVVVTESHVTFDVITTNRLDEMAPLDPVVFDRPQYQEAIAELYRLIEAWRPAPKAGSAD